jgi:hypothetical protein
VSWQQRGAARTAAFYRVQAVVAGLPSRHLISMALCGPEAALMKQDGHPVHRAPRWKRLPGDVISRPCPEVDRVMFMLWICRWSV